MGISSNGLVQENENLAHNHLYVMINEFENNIDKMKTFACVVKSYSQDYSSSHGLFDTLHFANVRFHTFAPKNRVTFKLSPNFGAQNSQIDLIIEA